MRPLAFLLGLVVFGLFGLASRPAFAIGEVIRDVRIRDNARTDEETIRSIAGVAIGDTMEVDTLENVRERLNTSGLFADVNVYWEPYRDGVRVNIVIKDKFPWAPIPTFSYAPGNISGGLAVGHGNLFGRGKRGLIGGRLSTTSSGAVAVYQDPALFGSWLYWDVAARYEDMTIPEFANTPQPTIAPVRETDLTAYGFSASLGVAWFRRVRTNVSWNVQQFNVKAWRTGDEYRQLLGELPAPTEGGLRATIDLGLTFDFRAREHAVMYGNALGFSADFGDRRFGADQKFTYWKARGEYEHGFRLFRRHNLILRLGGFIGKNLPLWSENTAGGSNLRGYVYREFAGDTQIRSQVEYHFPLFSVGPVDLRGVVFNDDTAIWFRKLPPPGPGPGERHDGRTFLPPEYLQAGFDRDRDIHSSAGAGLRFFLRSVAVPLVGIDFGYGFPNGPVRMVLAIGG